MALMMIVSINKCLLHGNWRVLNCTCRPHHQPQMCGGASRGASTAISGLLVLGHLFSHIFNIQLYTIIEYIALSRINLILESHWLYLSSIISTSLLMFLGILIEGDFFYRYNDANYRWVARGNWTYTTTIDSKAGTRTQTYTNTPEHTYTRTFISTNVNSIHTDTKT